MFATTRHGFVLVLFLPFFNLGQSASTLKINPVKQGKDVIQNQGKINNNLGVGDKNIKLLKEGLENPTAKDATMERKKGEAMEHISNTLQPNQGDEKRNLHHAQEKTAKAVKLAQALKALESLEYRRKQAQAGQAKDENKKENAGQDMMISGIDNKEVQAGQDMMISGNAKDYSDTSSRQELLISREDARDNLHSRQDTRSSGKAKDDSKNVHARQEINKQQDYELAIKTKATKKQQDYELSGKPNDEDMRNSGKMKDNSKNEQAGQHLMTGKTKDYSEAVHAGQDMMISGKAKDYSENEHHDQDMMISGMAKDYSEDTHHGQDEMISGKAEDYSEEVHAGQDMMISEKANEYSDDVNAGQETMISDKPNNYSQDVNAGQNIMSKVKSKDYSDDGLHAGQHIMIKGKANDNSEDKHVGHDMTISGNSKDYNEDVLHPGQKMMISGKSNDYSEDVNAGQHIMIKGKAKDYIEGKSNDYSEDVNAGHDKNDDNKDEHTGQDMMISAHSENEDMIEDVDTALNYQVVEKHEGYEERLYFSHQTICTSYNEPDPFPSAEEKADDWDMRQGLKSSQLDKLQEYLSGNNQLNMSVVLEWPISVVVKPLKNRTMARTMCVWTSLNKSIPQPSNTQLKIETVMDPISTYSRPFFGRTNELKYRTETKTLLERIMADGLGVTADFSQYSIKIYDDGIQERENVVSFEKVDVPNQEDEDYDDGIEVGPEPSLETQQ